MAFSTALTGQLTSGISCQERHRQLQRSISQASGATRLTLRASPRGCRQRQRGRFSGRTTVAFSNVETPERLLQAETVADVMFGGDIHSVSPDTSVDHALELLVSNRVTGLPVLDDDGTVVGVVSDYDLLSLEGIAESAAPTVGNNIFPELSMEWNAFRQVQRLISKNAGKTVADVMTEDPVVVRPETNMSAAAKVLLDRKVRRLPVVDKDGRLLGMITRHDIIKAALAQRQAAADFEASH